MYSDHSPRSVTTDAGLQLSHPTIVQPGLLVPILTVGAIVLSLMFVFEFTKELFFPTFSKWESHLVTIGFSMISAMVTSYFVLRHQHALHRQDLLERTRADNERRALERKLLETQHLESLGVLAGGIAHDFNNLLTTILGNAELALFDLDPTMAAYQSIEHIVQAAQLAADLTQQMLSYAGKGRVIVSQIDLNAVVTEVIPLVRISVAKYIQVHSRCAPHLPTIDADATQIHQVVMNLLINAAEAIGETEGQIAVCTGMRHADREYLATTQFGTELAPGPYVFVEVTDTGCGMDHATLAKMFEPFFTTKFTGRGLGLAAVLGIVREHRGTLTVQSTLGHGTTFTVLLPCTLAQPPGTTMERQASVTPAAN